MIFLVKSLFFPWSSYESPCAARSHLIVAGSESGSLLVPPGNAVVRSRPYEWIP